MKLRIEYWYEAPEKRLRLNACDRATREYFDSEKGVEVLDEFEAECARLLRERPKWAVPSFAFSPSWGHDPMHVSGVTSCPNTLTWPIIHKALGSAAKRIDPQVEVEWLERWLA